MISFATPDNHETNNAGLNTILQGLTPSPSPPRLREGKDLLIPSPQVAEAGHESLGPAVAGGFVPERAVAMNLGAGKFRASKVGAGASSPSPSFPGWV